jgi:hypothetical protein
VKFIAIPLTRNNGYAGLKFGDLASQLFDVPPGD